MGACVAMGLLKFEIKKIWRQKKIIWLLLVVLLGVGGIFYQNASEQDAMKDRALEKIRPYVEETDGLYHYFKQLEYENDMDESRLEQQEHVIELGTIFFRWKGAIHNTEWSEIPSIQHEFLKRVELLEEAGGDFSPLYGIERERTIQKNDWLLKQQLPYVDEEYALSPSLVLKQSSTLLLSLGGILFLMLFFGNAVTAEKEQQTWLTLKTQPISKWKRMLAKYGGLLFVMFVFLLIVLCVGLLIPYMFGEKAWHFDYPQLLNSGNSFAYISTFSYLVRIFLLFFSAGALIFSLILLLSTQLKSSFSVLVLTGFIGAIGISVTLLNEWLQTFWNPFHLFSINNLVSETVQDSFWLYPLAAICWSGLLLLLAILIPEGEKGLFGESAQKKPYDKGRTRHVRIVFNSAIFEWRKLKRRGLLKQSFIVLGLFAIIGYFLLGQISNAKEIDYIDLLNGEIVFYTDTLIPLAEKDLASIDEEKKAAEESGDESLITYYNDVALHQRQTMLAYYQDILSKIERGKRAYEQQDWHSFYQYQEFDNRLANGEFDHEYMDRLIGPLSYVTLEASIAEKEWLMEHKIQPIIAGSTIPTIYENWGDAKESKKDYIERNRKVENNGLFSLYLYFDNYLYFIPLFLFAVIVGAGLADERGKRPTIKMLQTQPINEQSVFYGKVLTGAVVGLTGLTGIFTFIVLFSSLFNRFGDWYYPILHYNSKSVVESAGYTGMRALEGGFHFIPLGNYVVSSMALIICIFLFVIALSHVFALFIPRTLVVFSSVALVCGIGYFVSEKMGSFALFSPFMYFDIGRIVNGEVATVLNNPSITVLNGCMVLLGMSVFLMVIGYVVLRLRGREKVKGISSGRLVVEE